MCAVLEHYDKIHLQLIAERDALCRDLRQITSSPRYDQLTEILQSFHDEECTKLQKGKDRKLDCLLSSSNASNDYWVAELGLCHSEKNIILKNEALSDKSIDAAVKLLSRHSPDLHIQSCLLSPEMLTYAPLETLHIHHTGAYHFCTSA